MGGFITNMRNFYEFKNVLGELNGSNAAGQDFKAVHELYSCKPQ